MAGIMAAVYMLGVVIAVGVVWLILHRRQSLPISPAAVPVIRAARRRALVAVLFAVTLFLAGVVLGMTFPEYLGMPVAVTPLIAASVGLGLYAATPPSSVAIRAGEPRSARLERRTLVSFASRRAAAAWLVTLVFFTAVIVLCGLTASADEAGRSRVIRFTTTDASSAASPYPGWFYGVPSLIALAVLVGATLFALHRISTTPALPQSADARIDELWRRRSADVALMLSSGAMLFALGGVACTAGLTMNNAIIEGQTAVIWSVLADSLLIGGVAALVLSIVGVTRAGLTAATLVETTAKVSAAR